MKISEVHQVIGESGAYKKVWAEPVGYAGDTIGDRNKGTSFCARAEDVGCFPC